MKKTILTTLIALFLYLPIIAQPGWSYKVTGNLNNIDSTSIKKCINAKNSCYFGYILIDSITDLSRLKHLNAATNLDLIIELHSIPKELSTVHLNQIKILHLSGSQLENVYNLPVLSNLEKLTISGYQNDTLKIKNKLPSLKILELDYSDKIVSIDNIFLNKNLEQLKIRSCKNIELINQSFVNLKYLSIDAQSTKIKWEDLVYFKSLEEVFLTNTNFETLPDKFPKSLRKISISKGNTNLKTLNKLQKLKTLEELNLRNINLVWKK